MTSSILKFVSSLIIILVVGYICNCIATHGYFQLLTTLELTHRHKSPWVLLSVIRARLVVSREEWWTPLRKSPIIVRGPICQYEIDEI
ncbi:hypothetical protein BJV77DRAFT_993143 [Russula vinacea]|nr:hypothetical protein BJV77DRAFT_993143 [Russula vinacea]